MLRLSIGESLVLKLTEKLLAVHAHRIQIILSALNGLLIPISVAVVSCILSRSLRVPMVGKIEDQAVIRGIVNAHERIRILKRSGLLRIRQRSSSFILFLSTRILPRIRLHHSLIIGYGIAGFLLLGLSVAGSAGIGRIVLGRAAAAKRDGQNEQSGNQQREEPRSMGLFGREGLRHKELL